MKKLMITLMLVLGIALSVSGCMNGGGSEYEIVTRHRDDSSPISYDLVSAANYDELKNAVYELISKGGKTGIVRIIGYDGVIEDDLEKVCVEIANNTAIGAYGIYYLTGTVNKIVSYYEAKISVTYNIDPSEMKEIAFISGPDQLESVTDNALSELSDHVTLFIEPEATEFSDIEKYIQNAYYKEPLKTVYEPDIKTENVYPVSDEADPAEIGEIIKVIFTYPASAEEISAMRDELGSELNNLVSLASGENDAERLFSVSSLITEELRSVAADEMNDGQPAGKVDSPYGALIDNTASSKGIALAFKAVCDKMELPCQVISGEFEGKAHFWNIVEIDGQNYHVDLALCRQRGYEEYFLENDESLSGDYSWDTSVYPPCVGNGDFSYLTAETTDD